MYFTQEDYKKIENWLHRNSVKDTEFQEALPFTGKEIVTVVQDGHNRKVNIQEFINQLYKYGVRDFLNVTNTYRANNITLKEAISLIPAEARKEGQVITFLNTDGNWEIYQFTGKLNQWNNTTLWNNPFDWEKFVIDSILPDEEDLTKSEPDAKGNSYLSLKDRKYEPDKYSGLGRKILRRRVVEIKDPIYGTQEKNLLLQADFAEDNTVYVVRYDFTLNSQDITLPDNSYIEYEGGSISDGNIIDRAGGLNRVVLKKNIINGKNILTQDMVSTPNTIYEIRYDFTLGEDITVPDNCVLEFDGGSIRGNEANKNIIIGNNTKVICNDYDEIILSIYLNGTWDKEYFTICNFGCAKGSDKGISNSSILNIFCNTSLNAITNNVSLIVPQGVYNISTPVQFNASFDFICVGTLKYDGVIDNISALTIGSPGNNGGYARKYVIALEGNLTTYVYDESAQQYVIPENYGLKMYGMANSNIVIDKVTNFAYGVTLIGNDRGFACNSIYVGYIMNSYRCLTLSCEQSGYVNENLITGGRYYCESNCSVAGKHTAISLLGSNIHIINNNVFIKPNVEAAKIGIYTSYAADNTFYSPRTEEDINPYINDTYYYANKVIHGNGVKCPEMLLLDRAIDTCIAKTDNLGRIKFGNSTVYSAAPLYSADINDGVVVSNNFVPTSAVLGGFFIDTSTFKLFTIKNGSGRAFIHVYDINYNHITITEENKHLYVKNTYLDVFGGGLQKGADINITSVCFTDEVKVAFLASNAGNNSLYIYCNDSRYGGENLVLKPFDSSLVNTFDIPTQTINVADGTTLKTTSRYAPIITCQKGEWYRQDGVNINTNNMGSTSQRPSGTEVFVGFVYFDTDLNPNGKPIFVRNIAPDTNRTVTWVDATGASV